MTEFDVEEMYVPPLSKGTRVRATAKHMLPVGSLGTITWTHPWPDTPYRVLWDGYEPKAGDLVVGMSDIGWLTRPEEIEVVEVPQQPDGIAEDSQDYPDPVRAAQRVNAFIADWGDGLLDQANGAPLYARDLASLARFVLNAQSDEVKR